MPPPTDYAPPPIGMWTNWGQALIFLVLFMILLILLVNFFFPRKPGEKPKLIALIIVIIGIIVVFGVIGLFWIMP